MYVNGQALVQASKKAIFSVYTETIQYEWEHYGSTVKAVLNRATGHCIVSITIALNKFRTQTKILTYVNKYSS